MIRFPLKGLLGPLSPEDPFQMKSYHMSNKYMRVFWWNTSSSTYVSVQKYILTKVDARHMWELSWKINWGYEASLPVLRQVDAVVPQNQHAHQDQHLQVTAHAHLQGSTSKRFKRIVRILSRLCICMHVYAFIAFGHDALNICTPTWKALRRGGMRLGLWQI